jgi:hypothetical protein
MARQRKAAQQAEEMLSEESALQIDTPASDLLQPTQAIDASSPPAREPGNEPEQSWVKRASIIVDPEAGVKFHFDYENHKAVITFDEKPSPELLVVARPIMTARGFHWDTKANPVGWAKRLAFTTREDDRREAKKTFYQVANAVREHKGLPMRSFGEVLPT